MEGSTGWLVPTQYQPSLKRMAEVRMLSPLPSVAVGPEGRHPRHLVGHLQRDELRLVLPALVRRAQPVDLVVLDELVAAVDSSAVHLLVDPGLGIWWRGKVISQVGVAIRTKPAAIVGQNGRRQEHGEDAERLHGVFLNDSMIH